AGGDPGRGSGRRRRPGAPGWGARLRHVLPRARGERGGDPRFPGPPARLPPGPAPRGRPRSVPGRAGPAPDDPRAPRLRRLHRPPTEEAPAPPPSIQIAPSLLAPDHAARAEAIPPIDPGRPH